MTLPATDFGKRAASPDGMHPYCKTCVREYCKERYSTHAEEIKASVRSYRERNSAAISDRARIAYMENKPKYAASMAAHYAKNRDALLAKSKLYRAALDPEAERAYKRSYRKANRALTREWEHRRRVRERAATVIPLTRAMIAAKVDYWGGKCWVCGIPFEAIDHVKPIAKGGPHILANLRPICGSCNSKKHSIWPYTTPIDLSTEE